MNSEVFENCSTILLDIAGTVGSINFTKDTLYVFAKKNVEEYLTTKWEEEEIKKLVAELKGDGEDLADVTKAVARFNTLTDENSINTGLKTLQGLLYKQGYAKGELKAHVFDDVKTSLEEWSKHRKICIYSTGAEEAQKQYFAHSTAGDLTDFISKYFDQSVGKKTTSESYESIAKALAVKPEEMVFISDDIEEIKAAVKAGCATAVVIREGNVEITETDKTDRIVVSTLADLPLSAKRKMPEETSSEGPPAKVAKIEQEKTEDKNEEKTTEVAAESMEVDSSEASVKTTELSKPTEETTEKSAEAVPVESAKDVEMAEAPTTEPETTTTTDKEAEAAVPATEKSEESETQKTEVDTTTEKAEEATSEKKETVEEPVAKESVSTSEAEAKPTEIEEKKTIESETKEEVEDTKRTEAETKVDAEEVKENGEEKKTEETTTKVEENGTASNDVEVEEKENKSEIANGAAEVTTETDKEKNGGAEGETAEEVKVKKIEESTENTASVAVET